MATSPATVSDLSNRSLRPLSAQETTVGGVLLEDAWNVLIARRPSVITRLDTVPVDAVFRALVIQVQVAMVLRVLNNPDGKFEETGDNYSYRRDQAVSTGMLYLSDAEFDLIGDGGGGGGGAFTIRPTGISYGPGYWSDTTTWVPLIP